MFKGKIHQSLHDLSQKYEDNTYLSKKLENYIETILPAYMESAEKDYMIREKRKQGLELHSEEFIERFISKSRCFYCPNNELFVLYDGIHFSGFSEDNIVHKILSQITQEKKLCPWKHKIKNSLIRRIKEKSPLNAIPESVTIQSVLNSLLNTNQKMFNSRNHAKYFLTVVGDCLHNKIQEHSLKYFVSPAIKLLMREIEIQIYTFFGYTNSFQNIKYKYYEHDYESARLLYIDEKRKPIQVEMELSKYMLDLLCVSSHYSIRYQGADNFLQQCTDTVLVNHVLYLKKNTPESIVSTFVESCIQTGQQVSIKSKNMKFIWKKFLEERNMPNILFQGSLSAILREKLNYDCENDVYKDVTSVHIPFVGSFIQFWDKHIKLVDETEIESELEIEELSKIFRKEEGKHPQSYDDSFILELIKHFYPDVIMEEDKYFVNVKCDKWDKFEDVINSLELFKIKCNNIETNVQVNSLYNAYQMYVDDMKSDLIVSKRYYDKIAKSYIGDALDDEGIISPSWWNAS